MTNYNFGEILLLKFPYSDGKGDAKRPVVVLAQTDLEDIVTAKVTSMEQRGEYDIAIDAWKDVGLLYPSVVRIDKLATLSKQRVEKRFGTLVGSYKPEIISRIKQLFKIEK
ncbi:MAG: type II toxin-antitoxin system PemK/MazF family toxin [Candidatus Kuenenia stuttgartiensis]|jgi:mRNA interferase MazF|uniref:PemK-like protein n=1 Tax=Kuenenia stuttgartiensis TaxID=174633 RepID=Q1Q0Z8_KUEST|nr:MULTISPECIES: type II toxin-antitoxin system PemK/MazF family toxin [Kuenenia]MBE7547785.1 type II toxin-antitoxin system PemK/MazF family toxin [Planctomycetia bacterium]MBW7943252.1 type II toxin-antitoxin system PemK/MazF family toxin [Candidatus Kuenenia stuttgartiensis]MBZ0191272.1 type II toxin-antitoxin system PemK/MazF family toxin [Candidatus Kuenenia stuttgartiensis]MCZ7623590.1 type II toxin-antitoxin system PemK/MazF family toxin [Candidatus Kuenenia sp.]CAJ73677.1 conserved hyp